MAASCVDIISGTTAEKSNTFKFMESIREFGSNGIAANTNVIPKFNAASHVLDENDVKMISLVKSRDAIWDGLAAKNITLDGLHGHVFNQNFSRGSSHPADVEYFAEKLFDLGIDAESRDKLIEAQYMINDAIGPQNVTSFHDVFSLIDETTWNKVADEVGRRLSRQAELKLSRQAELKQMVAHLLDIGVDVESCRTILKRQDYDENMINAEIRKHKGSFNGHQCALIAGYLMNVNEQNKSFNINGPSASGPDSDWNSRVIEGTGSDHVFLDEIGARYIQGGRGSSPSNLADYAAGKVTPFLNQYTPSAPYVMDMIGPSGSGPDSDLADLRTLAAHRGMDLQSYRRILKGKGYSEIMIDALIRKQKGRPFNAISDNHNGDYAAGMVRGGATPSARAAASNSGVMDGTSTDHVLRPPNRSRTNVIISAYEDRLREGKGMDGIDVAEAADVIGTGSFNNNQYFRGETSASSHHDNLSLNGDYQFSFSENIDSLGRIRVHLNGAELIPLSRAEANSGTTTLNEDGGDSGRRLSVELDDNYDRGFGCMTGIPNWFPLKFKLWSKKSKDKRIHKF